MNGSAGGEAIATTKGVEIGGKRVCQQKVYRGGARGGEACSYHVDMSS